MARALQRRDVDRQTLSDYVLDEVETFEVLGPGRRALRADATRIHLVRARRHPRAQPCQDTTACPIGESERREYEDRWFKREQEPPEVSRTEREAKREAGGQRAGAAAPRR